MSSTEASCSSVSTGALGLMLSTSISTPLRSISTLPMLSSALLTALASSSSLSERAASVLSDWVLSSFSGSASGAGVSLDAGLSSGAGLSLDVGVSLGVGAGVSLGVGVGLSVESGVAVGVGAGLSVESGVAVGVGVGVSPEVWLLPDTDGVPSCSSAAAAAGMAATPSAIDADRIRLRAFVSFLLFMLASFHQTTRSLSVLAKPVISLQKRVVCTIRPI